MTPSIPNTEASPLHVCGGRASSVIVQKVPRNAAEVFMEWQRGISAEAAKFLGYQTTEIFPPLGEQDEWVTIIHFDDSKTLQGWLDSTQRAEWIAKLPRDIRDYRLKMLPTGFGGWFAGLSGASEQLPHWKMFLVVLFSLYPTVILLNLFLAPHTQRFGPAVSLLIGNAVSVAFLEWMGMPIISRILGPWLHANSKAQRASSIVGLILILGSIGLVTLLYHVATQSH